LETTYFGDATLVLVGGGVGGIAFAGACLAAESRGCRFHAAAATSIGAIVATLVAAGFKGRELVRTVHAISICDLPDAIEHCINDRLCEKLGIRKPVVTFSDLPRPLMILAADLRRGSAQSWGRRTDPEMPVGLAVRCACANPFRCPPVEIDGRLFADGSLLGNLPVGESYQQNLEQCSQLPALVFQLARAEFPDSGQEVEAAIALHRVGDIVISGRAGMPSGLPMPCQPIEIPTGVVRPADLALSGPAVRKLVRDGYDAVINFFADEAHRVAMSGYLRQRLKLAPQSTLIEQTLIQLRSARRNIFIAGGDLSWASEAFPVLALKALEGISIQILSAKSIAPVLAATLGRLGCEVRQSANNLLTYGAFIDPDEPDGTAILVRLPDGKLRGGTWVGARSGSGVLAALMDRLRVLWRQGTPHNTVARPEFEIVEWRVVEAALRAHVVQYRQSAISLQSVEVSKILPLTHYLTVAGFRRAEALAELCKQTGGRLFDPMRVRNSSWFLAPPVIEMVNGRLALIAGTHRVYHCRNHGIATINAILVQGASDPLPAKVCQNWDAVLPLSCHVGRDERYKQYDASRWRDIRSAWAAVAHQSLPSLPSLQACRYPATLPQS
jgi:NTE family protein